MVVKKRSLPVRTTPEAIADANRIEPGDASKKMIVYGVDPVTQQRVQLHIPHALLPALTIAASKTHGEFGKVDV